MKSNPEQLVGWLYRELRIAGLEVRVEMSPVGLRAWLGEHEHYTLHSDAFLAVDSQQVREEMLRYFRDKIVHSSFMRLRLDNKPVFRKKAISRAPGGFLQDVATFFCSPKTVDQIARPVIADIQSEYIEALCKNQTTKAFWVRVRGYWTFWKAMGLYASLKSVAEIWRKLSMG